MDDKARLDEMKRRRDAGETLTPEETTEIEKADQAAKQPRRGRAQ